VSPLAVSEMTIEFDPVQPALSFADICGSQLLSRSRGTSSSTRPISVNNGFDSCHCGC
jgi:hypothetical protein